MIANLTEHISDKIKERSIHYLMLNIHIQKNIDRFPLFLNNFTACTTKNVEWND